MGGLGIKKLADSNIALLSKWLWRFKNEPNSLWRRVIAALHDTKKCWSFIPVNNLLPGVWRKIVKSIDAVKVSRVALNQFLSGVVGRGTEIRFWLDKWVCAETLKDRFPLLFKLEKEKKRRVVDSFIQGSYDFSSTRNWYRGLNTPDEFNEWNSLLGLLDGVSLLNRDDKWKWLGTKDDTMTVRAVKKFLISDKYFSNRYVFKWCKWVPLKCNVFIWRAVLDHLPTGPALIARNCGGIDARCTLCGVNNETVDHLFCNCSLVFPIWMHISSWCRVGSFSGLNVKDLIEFHKSSGLGKVEKKALKGIITVICWCIWKSRNEKRFSNVRVTAGSIIQSIKSLSFLWFKHRVKLNVISWQDWCAFKLD